MSAGNPVSYAADFWLGASESFQVHERATAAEAFADAVTAADCSTVYGLLRRLGVPPDNYSRYWDYEVTGFNVLRYVEEEIDADFRGVSGRRRGWRFLDEEDRCSIPG